MADQLVQAQRRPLRTVSGFRQIFIRIMCTILSSESSKQVRSRSAVPKKRIEESQTVSTAAVLSAHSKKGTIKTMESHNSRRIDTTLGELIAAASEVAFEYSDNDKDAYRLARLALIEMLKKASRPIDFEDEFLSTVTRKTYLH
jgi:hypothetical protein